MRQEQGLGLRGIEMIIDLAQLEEKFQIPILRSEAQLLALIKREPGNPVKYYLNKSGLSSRWFYKVLKQLVDCGLIAEGSNSADARQKLLY